MRMHPFGLPAVAMGAVFLAPGAHADEAPRFGRPVATYSIVARDAATGEMGVAVQSHWFSVGPVVPWAEAGVGAVATQSLVDVKYGPLGLALMRAGKPAAAALKSLTSTDPGADVRQVAMVDAKNTVAVHTGPKCIAEAMHHIGIALDGSAYSCQANLMRNKTVADAMARAFEEASPKASGNAGSRTPLAERLVAALRAAEQEGGDIRGRQSAAILVVKGASSGKAWEDKVVELRVEDHPNPVVELQRLLTLHGAYAHMNAGDEAMEKKDVDGALREYGAAMEIVPIEQSGGAEMVFWTAVSLVNAGKIAEAEPLLRRAFADKGGDWRETLRRLPRSGLLPDDKALIERLAGLEAEEGATGY